MVTNKPSQRDNYMQAPVTSFRILACMYLPLLGALVPKLYPIVQRNEFEFSKSRTA